MRIAFTLYDDMTVLDLVGPYQVLSMLPEATISLAASTPGPKRTDSGMTIVADAALADVPAPDVIVVPGTGSPESPLADATLIAWLASAHRTATWTASVCTGSLVLGAAGVLEGKRATTHWLALDALRTFKAEPVTDRVVFDGNVVTAAGVSSGIDMALALVARMRGEDLAKAIQLAIEYDPQPPFDSGSPAKAGQAVRDAATQLLTAATRLTP